MPASVLVVAVDPKLESLTGELVSAAGHRPLFDSTLGAAGESIRRHRPDVCVLDVGLPSSVLEHCLLACDEVRSAPVLTSNAITPAELGSEALRRACYHFAPEEGASALGQLLDRILDASRTPSSVGVVPSFPAFRPSPVHAELVAAIAGVARARTLTQRARFALGGSRSLREETAQALREARRSRDGLRAAVSAYAVYLRSSAVPAEQVPELVNAALQNCATILGAGEAVAIVAADSRRWALEAYGTM
jgi:hypothetical protein